MAKGKVKTRKAGNTAVATAVVQEIAAAAAAAPTGVNGKNVAVLPSPSDAKADDDTDDAAVHRQYYEIVCNHQDLNRETMQKVSSLLKELFTTSFEHTLTSLYREMIQRMQDEVLKEKVLSFLVAGLTAPFIKEMAKEEATRQGLIASVRMVCEEELPQLVLRVSTRDCFNLTCGLAVRHGHNLELLGPPCACYFSHCLESLEKWANHFSTTPPPVPPVRPIDRQALAQAMAELLTPQKSCPRGLWQLGQHKVQAADCIGTIGDAWQLMAELLWETANKVDPMQLPRVKEQLDFMYRLDGMELWYNTLIRELEPSKSSQPAKADSTSRTWMSHVTAEMRQSFVSPALELRLFRDKDNEAEIPGTLLPKAIAKALRDYGNTAYSACNFEEASEHYTRAMSYDSGEAVYPLNRAACMVKMSRYAEAEYDCTTSIAIDCTNHKAFFRRGVSRSHLSYVEGAISDFRRVLSLQRDDESTYTELRKLSLDTLNEVLLQQERKLPISLREIEACLPTHRELVSQLGPSSEEQDSGSESDCSLADQPSLPSVSDVFSQVSFAIAFSHVLKQHTGIDIKVPVACRSKP